jgi:hypothetical protein
MSPIDLSNVKFPDKMDLRTAALFLNISEMRVRTLAREGTLKATKTGGEGETKKWEFTKSDLEAFKATPRERKAGGPRGEGKAWIVNVPHDKLEQTKNALKALGIELQPRYDVAKQTAYRKKRAAAGKGQTVKATTPAPSGPKPAAVR